MYDLNSAGLGLEPELKPGRADTAGDRISRQLNCPVPESGLLKKYRLPEEGSSAPDRVSLRCGRSWVRSVERSWNTVSYFRSYMSSKDRASAGNLNLTRSSRNGGRLLSGCIVKLASGGGSGVCLSSSCLTEVTHRWNSASFDAGGNVAPRIVSSCDFHRRCASRWRLPTRFRGPAWPASAWSRTAVNQSGDSAVIAATNQRDRRLTSSTCRTERPSPTPATRARTRPQCSTVSGHQASYLKESETRVRNAATFPSLTVMSGFVTSATRRSRSEPAAVSTALRPAFPPQLLADTDHLDDLVDALCHLNFS